jgi:PAS domain S-box-containing protein
VRETFERHGELGRALLEVDWAATPLGPLERWPASLRTVVRMLLSSRFSMWMGWGDELTFFCNEAYRRDTLGEKFPWALGKPAAEVWSEVWKDVQDRVEAVRNGESTWDKSLRLFLQRSGYVEETYHTFSYSPVTDDDGNVSGLMCVVSEDTDEVIAQRRIKTLRDLGSRANEDLVETETIGTACEQIAGNGEDLPFTLVYTLDPGAQQVTLAGSTGFTGPHPAAPETIRLDDPNPAWPAAEVLAGEECHLTDLSERWRDLPTGAWDGPPAQALVLPLGLSPTGTRLGFLVAGLNRYRRLGEPYRGFLGLVAGQLTSGINAARAYDSERARAEALAELSRAKTDFLTNISHEFRTPLTLLLGPAEDALADEGAPLPQRQRERLDVVMRNGQRLLKLVNTLLDFSRLEAGRQEAVFELVDLPDYTRELASMFDSAAERLGLRLEVDCPPLSSPVPVDRDQWARIVMNLLSNALKFTFEGSVSLSLREVDGQAELVVADTGTGIPASDVPHLFERFHRVTGARARTHEGTGIGLALVAEVTELHGGTVEATSELGEGSRFIVRIPMSGDRAAEVSPVASSVPSEAVLKQAGGFLAEATHWVGSDGEVRGGQAGGETPRILVVDDNADIRRYVSELLSEDYVVETAVDGQDGLDRARTHPPDLVLTDVMMPRMDGFALLAALQEEPATVGVPVVMLSARAGEEGTVEGLDAGADDYLVKPFTARELVARVRSNLELDRARRTRRQLERSRSLLDQAQRLARVGSWEIDLRTGEVAVSDEFQRLAGRSLDELRNRNYVDLIATMAHPDDRTRVTEVIEAAGQGAPLQFEMRLVRGDDEEILVSVMGELARDDDGQPETLRGSIQDITERRAAERAIALAAANAEAAAREHAIADELQRSLLPREVFDHSDLEVASYYRAGVEGTQVGGDWYDVIDLGAGRTALVVGDVMGRGVQAAAVMGQLRAAVRAYARLDLPPVDVLEFVNGIVHELGDDQIVTCIYAVFDPVDHLVTYANAGHLPPIVTVPGEPGRRLEETADAPLGAASGDLRQHRVPLPAGSMLVLYTDGLVERRGEDLDLGVDALAAATTLDIGVRELPEHLARTLLPDGPDDDVAVLVARVAKHGETGAVSHRFESFEIAAGQARQLVSQHLGGGPLPAALIDDAVLVTSELITNAMLHGTAPIDLRVHANQAMVMLEVQDRGMLHPRKVRATPEDEHGRGLQIVNALCDRWGTRFTDDGKSVWCLLSSPGES